MRNPSVVEKPNQNQTEPRKGLSKELEELLNAHSAENGSDTPDFLLAEYLLACLQLYGKTVKARDKWFGFDPWGKMIKGSGLEITKE